jgi:hypothetical protein
MFESTRISLLSPAPIRMATRRPRWWVWKLCAVLAFGGPLAARAIGATITDLGSFVPSDVSKQGVVVGNIIDLNDDNFLPHAGIWRNGTLTRLPERSGTTQSDAVAVSETGRVVGLEVAPPAIQVHAVYWDGIAAPTPLGPFIAGDDFSDAADVDFAGNVVGTGLLRAPAWSVGYYAPGGGSLIQVGGANFNPATGGGSTIGAITGDGQTILGRVYNSDDANGYYLWSTASPAAPGIKLDITPPRSVFQLFGGSVFGQGIGNTLASDGTVLGYKGPILATGTWFLRTPDGTETEILGMRGHNAVNAQHVVVGSMDTTAPELIHAAMWDPQTKTVTDLNTLLPENSGFILFAATAINDNGDIVGIGAHNQAQVGFLLKPSCSVVLMPPTYDPNLDGNVFNDDDLTLTKLGPDAVCPREHEYPPGGT